MPNKIANKSADWASLPDVLLLAIFRYLHPRSLLRASQVCKQWYRVALDEFLWKDLFLHRYKPPPDCLTLAPEASSWLAEYKRLYYHTPVHESEVLKEHRDQVLHVSFSHDGRFFATSSKDGYVKVWEFGYPTYVKYYEDMKCYNWRYTQYTQFNESDTLLLVSGVHFGSHSTSGEIAVFNMQNGFALQCTVRNKPYDIFGTWYNDQHLLSGNLHWLGNFSSCSVLYLNKSSQDLENIYESVVMQLFKFHNINASSVRTIMVANCADIRDFENDSNCKIKYKRQQTVSSQSDTDADVEEAINVPVMDCTVDDPDSSAGKVTCVTCGQSREPCNCTVSDQSNSQSRVVSKTEAFWVDKQCELSQNVMEATCESERTDASQVAKPDEPPSLNLALSEVEGAVGESVFETNLTPCDTTTHPLPCQFGRGGECSNTIVCPPVVKSKPEKLDQSKDESLSNMESLMFDGFGTSSVFKPQQPKAAAKNEPEPDKYLIFTTGTRTFTPHQIGIKLIRHDEALGKMSKQAEYRRRHEQRVKRALHHHHWLHHQHDVIDDAPHDAHQDDSEEGEDLDVEMDEYDHLIEMNGHIIGMCLSIDQRYLYVNTRAWPLNYNIVDPLEPPPIAQQIEIHVIDLCTMEDLGTMHRAHKAFTPNDECFFIFLDVCEDYVASGAEDQHGYLWDRHYRILLNKFKHTDVVNSVAFHPKDSETLVSVSDDNSVKIWRSRNRCRDLGMHPKGDLEATPGAGSPGAVGCIAAIASSSEAHENMDEGTNVDAVGDLVENQEQENINNVEDAHVNLFQNEGHGV